MTCSGRHTSFQPGKLWARCHRCGAGIRIVTAHDPCTLLHTDDEVVCAACDITITGRGASSAMLRRKLMPARARRVLGLEPTRCLNEREP